jgi:Flp pilus assembly protein CpaB
MSKFIGPITLGAQVHFAKGDLIGSATVGLPPGKPVTEEAIERTIGKALAALPKGSRLLTADEFFNRVLVKEKTGQVGNFALPSSFDYDVDAITKAARASHKASLDEDEQ